jgi:uncharacterized membrane protein SirB2
MQAWSIQTATLYQKVKMITIFKTVHVLCAIISITGFLYRGYLKLAQPTALSKKWLKISPHIIDTILLATGLVMLFQLQYYPTQYNWMAIKLIMVVVYILLGIVALRFASNKTQTFAAFIAALLCYTYIILIATTKSAWPLA